MADNPATGIVVRGRGSVRDRAAGGSATAIAECRGVAARRRAANALAAAVVARGCGLRRRFGRQNGER